MDFDTGFAFVIGGMLIFAVVANWFKLREIEAEPPDSQSVYRRLLVAHEAGIDGVEKIVVPFSAIAGMTVVELLGHDFRSVDGAEDEQDSRVELLRFRGTDISILVRRMLGAAPVQAWAAMETSRGPVVFYEAVGKRKHSQEPEIHFMRALKRVLRDLEQKSERIPHDHLDHESRKQMLKEAGRRATQLSRA